MIGYNKETKQYNTFAMQFGWGMSNVTEDSTKKQYEHKKVYKYEDNQEMFLVVKPLSNGLVKCLLIQKQQELI